LPPETRFHEVQLRIRESYRNPNVGEVSQIVLKEGPRTFRVATVFEILDPKTGELHHHHLRLDHIDRRKGGWFAKPDRSFRCDADEITDLTMFLSALGKGKLKGRAGDLHIVDAKDYEQLASVLSSLNRLPSHDRIELTKALLAHFVGEGPGLQDIVSVLQGARPDLIMTIGLAARLIEYEAALDKLEALVEGPETKEQALQDHLKANPWMFGSEYSELLDRRSWTRDDDLDYMLRRTADGFLEIIEIKRATATALFNHDPSHDSFYMAAPLSKVVGQVIRYIDETQRQRDAILAKDGEETLKIRARVVMGRDGDAGQVRALKSLNGHLTQIEILTYDQLLRIACRVVRLFKAAEASGPEAGEEPPF
jgi:hypothetical protein